MSETNSSQEGETTTSIFPRRIGNGNRWMGSRVSDISLVRRPNRQLELDLGTLGAGPRGRRGGAVDGRVRVEHVVGVHDVDDGREREDDVVASQLAEAASLAVENLAWWDTKHVSSCSSCCCFCGSSVVADPGGKHGDEDGGAGLPDDASQRAGLLMPLGSATPLAV